MFNRRFVRMSTAVAALFLIALIGCVVVETGNGGPPSVSFTIGSKTFTFTLDATGLFNLRKDETQQKAAAIPLFTENATDNPRSAALELDINRVSAIPLGDQKGRGSAQTISGVVEVNVRIGPGDIENPCDTGIDIGAYVITIDNGGVSVDQSSLEVPLSVLPFVISGQFTICLEVTATIDISLTIEELDCVFGPADDGGGTNGNANDNDNGSANENDNGADNGNDNGSDPTCTVDADCATGETCTNDACVPATTVCVADTDCASGETCTNGECVSTTPACVADTDCATDETCTNGECVPATPACVADTDCATGETCANGECVPATPDCVADTDCATGETCTGGQCAVPPEPEFTLATINHVGSEQVIVGPRADEASGFGFIPESGWGVTHLAMSGNGQNMWFITENEFSEIRTERQRLYFIQGDGTNVQRSPVPLENITDGFDIPIMFSLATGSDGLRAVMEARRNIQPPTPETASVFYDLLSPGLPATVVYDTLGLPPLPPFGSEPARRIQMSDDGNFVSWNDETTIWRYPMNILNSVADAEFTDAGFACGNFAADTIGSFDRTAVDSRTLFGIRAVEGTEVCNTLILGSSQTDSAVQDMTQNDFVIQSVHISDDGLLMAYCLFSGIGSQADPAPCFVQGVNGPAAGFALSPTSDTWAKFTDIVLADSGIRYRVVVTTNVFAPNGISVFESPGMNDRKSTGTKMFGGVTQSISQVQLSFDGNEMAGLVPLSPSPRNNIYVLHDGDASLPGFPSIESVSHRYDAEADAFVFRVQVASESPVNLVQVYAMKNGIDPGEYLLAEENPFFDIRFGFGAVIAPVEGTTDLYEQTVPLFGLGNLIDDTYVLRIVVLDGARARTVFADIPAPKVIP